MLNECDRVENCTKGYFCAEIKNFVSDFNFIPTQKYAASFQLSNWMHKRKQRFICSMDIPCCNQRYILFNQGKDILKKRYICILDLWHKSNILIQNVLSFFHPNAYEFIFSLCFRVFGSYVLVLQDKLMHMQEKLCNEIYDICSMWFLFYHLLASLHI